ncbi:acetyl-coenzyme A synthetase 2-like, mitochondrial [Montipora capricornis]|uniref:acetyl-coenzyme A synthetase 2-like, mitochondrial n=1 Tax=Montipora capricornis TaxID=246305 RepID=UPI0035F19FC9
MAGIHIARRLLPAKISSLLCRRISSFFTDEYTPPKLDHVTPDWEKLYEQSIKDPATFWGRLGATRLDWMTPFDTVMDVDLNVGQHKWFLGGKLNVSVNCVDQHTKANPDRCALIWEKDEPGDTERVSYRELYEMVNKMANLLKSHCVKKGDVVCIYMPVSPLAVAAMLACARIGAPHSVVFAGFSSEALASRIVDANAETVITADQAVRGGKVSDLKKMVDKAVASSPCVKRVFVASRTGADVPMGAIDFSLEKEMSKQPGECEPEPMDSEDTLFLLYTSGSTGQPKGVVHTQAGYLLYAKLTHRYVFDYHPGDIFGCVADIGWITGHTYVVYGPLSNGATTVLFESTPTYPDPGRYWEMVERLRINQFYGAPTALRLLLKSSSSFVTKYDRSSLKLLGTVGEPINAEAWRWYSEVVGEKRCVIVDTWWQTETGGILLSPRPAPDDSPVKPEYPTRPFFGVKPVLLDEKGRELMGNDVKGALCISTSIPSMSRTIYGHHQRFLDTYYNPFKGFYFTGDGALRDQDGDYRITGRMDDVINVSGKRLGTAEIEDAMDSHDAVAETAVVGFPHPIKGEGIYAYAILKDNATITAEELRKDLKDIVRQKIGSFAVPEVIQVVSGLPKTRSGKIMRRILRKVAQDKPDELGDVSTLADPTVVKEIVRQHLQLAQEGRGKYRE